MTKKHIIFTGGGTAGHVIPNIPIIEALKQKHWTVEYIGSSKGIERDMMKALDVPFHSVRSGKLRRYFSFRHLLEPLNILVGIMQSWWLLFRKKPNLVFSKGGFVAFPVVVGAWLNKIPVIAHESDISPGLANRLSFPFVNKICVTFDIAKKAFKNSGKVEYTGTPIRESLFQGNREKGLTLCKFVDEKPVVLVIGGSQGAVVINQCVRNALSILLDKFNIIHICGAGKFDQTSLQKGYYQLEYANEELPDLFAAADIVVSRAGSNSLHEILALAKPHVLIPLSARVSRGDQIQNAKHFAQKKISTVIDEELLTPELLSRAIFEVNEKKDLLVKEMHALNLIAATDKIVGLIERIN